MKKISYDDLTIDFSTQQISQADEILKLDPKAFSTLTFLVENRERLVSNDELIKEVWDGREITNDVVVSAIGRIRKLFKDANVEDEVIHTVHKVGYQFTLNIIVDAIDQNQVSTLVPTSSVTPFSKKLNWLLTLALLISVSFITYNKFYALTDELPKPVDTNLKSNSEKNPNIEIFFVRHADKNTDEGDNPHLSNKGISRANYWQQFFKHIVFDEIYSTEFHRNMETAAIIKSQHLNRIVPYSALSFEIIQQLQKINGKKVLIIGHSNTIPDMVNRIIGANKYPPLSHKNYDHIYHVIIGKNGDVSSNLYYLNLPFLIDKNN